MVRPVLPFLETMITQACNISCHGCTNYSDLSHSGYVRWETGREWISSWLERIDIPDFGIMGGEPLINPEVKQWLKGVRDLMPNSQIRFTTNGLLLEKHFDIVDFLADLGNVSFKITIHLHDEKVETLVNDIFNRFNWQPIHEYGIDRWITNGNFRFHVKRPTSFVKTYKNDYRNMEPWHSDPAEAFSNCCQPTCPLLYNGLIYKCSTSALLESTLSRFGYPNKDQWEPYLPTGLSIDSSDDQVNEFIDNFGKPSAICGQCPVEHSAGSKIIHLDTVTKKKTKVLND